MSNPVPQRELAWSQVDVFAERAYEGNMLAIFHDGTGLSTAQMQSLARETNLSETTFILPQHAETEAREGVQVRIFTTQEELPFAGHPTLGTASWLYWNHPVFRGSSKIRLRLKAGVIEVQFKPSAEGEQGVYGEMQQFDPVFGATHTPAAIAEALGLLSEDLDASLEPQTVSTGMPFCIVGSPGSIRALAPHDPCGQVDQVPGHNRRQVLLLLSSFEERAGHMVRTHAVL